MFRISWDEFQIMINPPPPPKPPTPHKEMLSLAASLPQPSPVTLPQEEYTCHRTFAKLHRGQKMSKALTKAFSIY